MPYTYQYNENGVWLPGARVTLTNSLADNIKAIKARGEAPSRRKTMYRLVDETGKVVLEGSQETGWTPVLFVPMRRRRR